MSKKINPLVYPDFSRYVHSIIQKNNLTLPFMARRMNYSADTVYRLFKNPNWKAQDIKAAGDILRVNLFSFYTKEIDAAWQQQVDELNQKIATQQTQISAIEQEKLLLKTENDLMRQMLGAKKE